MFQSKIDGRRIGLRVDTSACLCLRSADGKRGFARLSESWRGSGGPRGICFSLLECGLALTSSCKAAMPTHGAEGAQPRPPMLTAPPSWRKEGMCQGPAMQMGQGCIPMQGQGKGQMLHQAAFLNRTFLREVERARMKSAVFPQPCRTGLPHLCIAGAFQTLLHWQWHGEDRRPSLLLTPSARFGTLTFPLSHQLHLQLRVQRVPNGQRHRVAWKATRIAGAKGARA